MRIILILCFFVFSVSLFSQKMSIPLRRSVSELSPSEQLVFYVKGDNKKIKEEVRRLGGSFRHAFRGYISVSLPAKEVENFTNLNCVSEISYTYSKPKLLSDSMRVKSNIMPVYNGASPLPQAYKGKNVIIGIIDTGIDFTHPDFQDSLGNTIVLSIWDQTIGTPTKLPTNFSYGQEWDSTDINAGVCTHVDPASSYGHGTNVCAIAASTGNATGSYLGAAPGANLIVVASDFNAPNWLATVADAIEYIYAKADSLGMPCVINISAGTYSGSHDGLDLDAQRIDSLMKAKSGRALVAAAGNAGDYAPFHLGYNLSSDTNFTWFEYNPSVVIPPYANNGSIYFELYADTADFNGAAKFSFGADLTIPTYKNRGTMSYLDMPSFYNGNYASRMDINGIFVDSIINNIGQKLADISIGYYKTNNQQTYVMQVIISPDSSVTDYAWRFITTGQGKFDIWSTSESILGTSNITYQVPNSSIFPDSIYYKQPDSLQSIVSSFQCLPDVITVGNYVNLNQYVDYQGVTQTPIAQPVGELYSSSSLGPTRLGVTKPTVSAPGSTTMAATLMTDLAVMITAQPNNLSPDGMHRTANGTSMAAPSVAGVVALLFESCPNYDYAHIKNALISGAKSDNFTGSTPNNYYGFGKVDALQSIMHTSQPVSIINNVGTVLVDTFKICTTAPLSLNQQFLFQNWNTNESTASIIASSSGLYYASGIDVNGCLQSSDTINVIINPFIIPKPILNTGDTSVCENLPITVATTAAYSSYLWSTGANTSTLTVLQTGGYRVLVADADGCKAYSDSIHLTFFVTPPKPIVSVLNDTMLTSTIASIYQWYYENTVLNQDTNQTMYAQDTGYYYVEVFHPNGCSSKSDSVFVAIPQPTGVQNIEKNKLLIYPNPFVTEILIQSFGKTGFSIVEVYNELGVKLLTLPLPIVESPIITKIGMNDFSSGVYFLYFRGNENMEVRKVLKK